tara:strand:- start:100869 stop:102293 length:1425 start_codon:yes stop_codon:yes gene_type:complete
MRQYAGFSDAESTNIRFKNLLNQGQSGLSVAFDLPTQLGLDSDDSLSEGEVGKVGVPIDSIDDMRKLFEDIDLGSISTSMTINAPASSLFALYVALADELGIDRKKLRGTVQNDILKEYIARGLYIFPPSSSLRLTTDLMNWCSKNTPLWNSISVSGYHMREAGCTAAQEIAFTISNGLQYIESAISSGMKVDDFAPRISFFFGCHNDFFEEVSKFRAARKLWYEMVTERYSPVNEKSAMLRFHTQTAGVTLTAQQPLNNAVRVSYQAMSAVLGGTQSLHTNSYDEAIGLPTEISSSLALRTQQILANETKISEVVDPLAGSYLVEELTATLIEEAKEIIETIDNRGGALECVISGYQQKEIHESAWNQLNSIESGTTKVVGVNINVEDGDYNMKSQILDKNLVSKQLERLEKIRQERNQSIVDEKLLSLKSAADGDMNLIDPMIDAYRSGATIGEVNGVLRSSFGTWIAPSGV